MKNQEKTQHNNETEVKRGTRKIEIKEMHRKEIEETINRQSWGQHHNTLFKYLCTQIKDDPLYLP